MEKDEKQVFKMMIIMYGLSLIGFVISIIVIGFVILWLLQYFGILQHFGISLIRLVI